MGAVQHPSLSLLVLSVPGGRIFIVCVFHERLTHFLLRKLEIGACDLDLAKQTLLSLRTLEFWVKDTKLKVICGIRGNELSKSSWLGTISAILFLRVKTLRNDPLTILKSWFFSFCQFYDSPDLLPVHYFLLKLVRVSFFNLQKCSVETCLLKTMGKVKVFLSLHDNESVTLSLKV